jgi:hypothetical protein
MEVTNEKDIYINAINNMLKDVDIEKLKVVCWYVQKIWMKD